MAFNILDLLAQAPVAQAAQAAQEAQNAPQEDSILVTASKPYDPRQESHDPTYNDPAVREPITPQYVLNDPRMQPTAKDLQSALPQRKGLFGLKGTLRDVLGTLGDAFLVQAGRNPIYRPGVEREQESDALFGFTQNPQQAIERLALHNPQAAMALNSQLEQQRARKLQEDNLNLARQSLIEKRDFSNREKGLNRLSRWVAGGVPYDKIASAARAYGISPEELAQFGVTPDMTPEERQQFASGDMTVNQQMMIPYKDAAAKVAQQRAESYNYSVHNRNPPPRPRADTPTETYLKITSIPEEKRTKGQQDFVNKFLYGNKSGGGRIGNVPPPPSSGSSPQAKKSRFTPVQ